MTEEICPGHPMAAMAAITRDDGDFQMTRFTQ
jgi:hypothetical protein